MKSKTNSIVLALFLAGPGGISAIQLQNINSKIRNYQDLATKKQMIKNDASFLQIESSQPYGAAQEERDTENGYPATTELEKKYPGNDHEAVTKTAQKFIDPKTGYMKSVHEVTLEEKAEKAKELQEKIDAPPGLGFKLNTDMVIPDDTGEKYHTTHLCYGSPCPKKDSFVQTGDNYVDESLYHDDTGTRWVTWMETYGRDPNPEYHDVHYMARPDFKADVDSKNGYKEQSFAQRSGRNQQSTRSLQNLAQKQDVRDVTDDSAGKWVNWPRTGKDPDPLYHDVHFMTRPDFNVSTLQWPRSLAEKKNVDWVTDDSADKWVNWPKTGKDPDPLYHDVHFMTRPDFNVSTLQWPRSLAQQKDVDWVTDDATEKWVYWNQGKDPNPLYHDVHYMSNPDFNRTTIQWPRSLAQAESKAKDDYIYDDWTGDKWVKYRQGREPFPPPHDPEWYKKDDFWHSIYQPVKPAQSFAQQQDDYQYDDWTGDRWVKYPKGKEPFPPPHDPEWYKKDDFWHSIYQPIKPAQSLAQQKDDYMYDDWTGDKWVKYPQGREPFPPPHDPEWYKKDEFWHSIYQPLKPAKSFAQQEQKDDGALDDWTGDRWAKHWDTFGREPFPPPHNPDWYQGEDFWHSVYQSPQSLVQLNEQFNGAYQPTEPYDQTLKDVDKIMDFYKEKDAKEELQKKEFELPGDPSGGINTIYAASIRHSKEEDNQYLKQLLEGYSMGGKGPNGLPNGERVLMKEQMMLASEEVINTWTTVSDPAVKVFEKENFDKVWNQYDNFNKGQIELDDGLPMLRTFMESEAPSEKSEDDKNPYMKQMIKEEQEQENTKKAELITKVEKKEAKKQQKKIKAAEEKELNDSAEEEGKLPDMKKAASDDEGSKKKTKKPAARAQSKKTAKK